MKKNIKRITPPPNPTSSRTVPVLLPLLHFSLVFPFHILPFSIHPSCLPISYFFFTFPGFLFLVILVPYSLFIFHLPRFTLPDFSSISFQASLPFSSCCYQSATRIQAFETERPVGQFRGTLKTPRHHFTVMLEGFQEVLILVEIPHRRFLTNFLNTN